MLKSRSKGEIAQLNVQLAAVNKNYLCSLPTNQESFYDILIDTKTQIVRAQIKFCNYKDGNNLRLRLDNKKSKRIFYRHTDVDWLLVYVPKVNKVLKYEKEHFHRKKRITINLNNPKSPWHFEKFLW